MKILDVDGFQKGIKEIEETLSSQKKQADQIAKAIQGVTDLDEAFKGKGGNAIRDFYRSKHLPLLEQYQTFLSDYQSVIKQMNHALQNLEPAPDGFMNEGFLENELNAGLHFAKQTTVHLTFEANETIKSVSDIVTLPTIEEETCMQYVVKAERQMSHSIEKVYEFDHAQTSSLSSLQGQVDALRKQIMQLNPVFRKMNFKPVFSNQKKFAMNHQEDPLNLVPLMNYVSNYFSEKVSSFIGTAEGVTYAYMDTIIDLVDTVVFLVVDPIGFIEGVLHALFHPIETAKYIWAGVEQSFQDEFVNGDVRSRARFMSYAQTYAFLSIAGPKGTDKVGKVGKIGKASRRGKGKSKSDVPYNAMTTIAIKSFLRDSFNSQMNIVEDGTHMVLATKANKRTQKWNAVVKDTNEMVRNTKNVLNHEKFKKIMNKTYQKVASSPVSRVANSEVFPTFKKLITNENGHVRFSWKAGDSKKGNKGTDKPPKITEIKEKDLGKHIIKGKNGRKELAPNVRYITEDGYKYTTDEFGRIVDVEAEELILQKGKRNKGMQAAAGREDRLPDDDGGHLIGTQFHGSGDIDNLLAQNKHINRSGGEWYKMETEWANAMKEVPPKKVSVKIKPVFVGTSSRPESYKVVYEIEGKGIFKKTIENKSGG
ncbi:DNA/RNA non-specific endonuclease [Rossellomorea marisflavi]|nr:T7SS effector LXG polymorphic toxin [Rossellomorea marisflavi]USK93057.1 DNA/RNA non-specific endonuclease [Rossellomorea marisflavi]